MSYVTNPAPPQPRRLWVRFLFPLIVLAVCSGLVALPFVGVALNLSSDELIIPLAMAAWLAVPIGVLLLAVWWLFFSPFRWRSRARFVILAAPIPLVLSSFANTSSQLRTRAFSRLAFQLATVGVQNLNRIRNRKYCRVAACRSDGRLKTRFRARADGVVTHLKLETDWHKHPPKVLWRRPRVEGYSGMAVAGNAIVTMERAATRSARLLRRATGRQHWVHHGRVSIKTR